MTVPYRAAIAALESMFNGAIDREVICAILEENRGHMEKTVECLLSIAGQISPEYPEDLNQVSEMNIWSYSLDSFGLQDETFFLAYS